MKYSSVIVTDENSDEEMEKLADQNGYRYGQFLGLYSSLGSEYTAQQNINGYEEWVTTRVTPNIAIDSVSPIIVSTVAYEFGNGFMLFTDIDSIFD